MAGLEGIKSSLGEGARTNKYKITIAELGGDEIATLAKAASLPGYTIGMAEVYSQGRKVPLAGDTAYDTWDVTFYNSKDMAVLQKVNDWMKSIDAFDTNTSEKAALLDYAKDVEAAQLDRQMAVTKTFKLKNAWPTTVSAVDLSSDGNDQVSEFTVTFAFTHFEVS